MQFQARLAPRLSVEMVTILLALTAASDSNVAQFSVRRGRRPAQWINYHFTTRSVGPLWKRLHTKALHHRKHGLAPRKSTIVTCEGSRGWDNYLLLHHFRFGQPLDRLAGV
jgi:hypothetical protein